MKQLRILFWISAASLCAGCVSAKKYTQLQQSHIQLIQKHSRDSVQAFYQEARLTTQKDSLFRLHDRLTNVYLELKNDSVSLSRNYQRNKRLLDDLFEKYEQLDKTYRQLSSSLDTETAMLAQGLSQKEKDLLVLEQKLLAQQAQNQKLSMQLQERETAIEAVEAPQRKQEKLLADWKKQIRKANLPGIDTAFQWIHTATRLAVKIPEVQLLDTTTYSLTPAGNTLLKTLASILRNQPDARITILYPFPKPPDGQVEAAKRIHTVFDFLQKEGVTTALINTLIQYPSKAYGQTKDADRPGTVEIHLGLKERIYTDLPATK